MGPIKNKIIVEGFWRLGKSALVRQWQKNFAYSIIKEPNHLKQKGLKNQTAIDRWYLAEHQKNLVNFFSQPKKKNIMERSILSSLAFFYAQGKFKGQEKILAKFCRYYNNFKPLVIFLYAGEKTIKKQSQKLKDQRVKRLLANKQLIKKYDYFFRNFLPFHCGLTPLFVMVENKTTAEIKKNILAALQHNRLAQVNIACWRPDKRGEPLFLLLKRNAKKGGFWQTISGGVKADNSLFQTIALEMGEETGLKFSPRRLLKINYTFNFIGAESYELNEYAFGYRLLKSEKIKLSAEHTEAKFVRASQALKLLKYDSNKIIIKKIGQKIKKDKA